MRMRLHRVWVDRIARPSKRWTTRFAVIIGFALLAHHLASYPELPDLSELGDTARASLEDQWAAGNVIAVVRHLERCDRADAACLDDAADGITGRSVAIGQELSLSFKQLGLQDADIFHSPLTRTAQTAQVLFGDHSVAQEWLYECRRSGNLLKDALQHKRPDRNLILITHSSCKDKFENDIGFDSEVPEYGTVWFTSHSEIGELPLMLGFLDADDWDVVFRKDGVRSNSRSL